MQAATRGTVVGADVVALVGGDVETRVRRHRGNHRIHRGHVKKVLFQQRSESCWFSVPKKYKKRKKKQYNKYIKGLEITSMKAKTHCVASSFVSLNPSNGLPIFIHTHWINQTNIKTSQ